MLPKQLYNSTNTDYSFKPIQEGILPAVVLIPVFTNHKNGILLTKRSDLLKHHPGQISFPGGVVSSTDTNIVDTALREWEEEVGVSKKHINILGRYMSIYTGTGFHISTVIGEYLGDFTFNTCMEEVDFIFQLYIDDFEKYPFYYIETNRSEFKELYYLSHPKGLIWGATCKILVSLLREFWNFKRKPQKAEFNLSKPPFFDPNC